MRLRKSSVWKVVLPAVVCLFLPLVSFADVTSTPPPGTNLTTFYGTGPLQIGNPVAAGTIHIDVSSPTASHTGVNILAVTQTPPGGLAGMTVANLGTMVDIYGIPSPAARTTTLTVRATDSGLTSGVDLTAYKVQIKLEITTSDPLPPAQVGVLYTLAFADQGGTPGPHVWSATGVPTGLTMSPAGVLSGTPLVSGDYNINVTVTDMDPFPDGQQVTRTFYLRVNPAALNTLQDYGKICYVEKVVRNASTGQVSTTGDLYTKDLVSGDVRRITAYNNPSGALLYPNFTNDGSKVYYTYAADPSSDANFKAYMVSVWGTVTDPAQGLIPGLPTSGVKYVAVSPDYAPNAGIIVYTLARSDRTELWRYEMASGRNILILSQQGLSIRNPVFIGLNSGGGQMLAYIGTVNGVQDIYIVNADGMNNRKVTANTATTPQYEDLQSSIRNPGVGYNDPWGTLLIYSKRTWLTYNYGNWDVFLLAVNRSNPAVWTEYNLTNTTSINEMSPCLMGDAGAPHPPAYLGGELLYSMAFFQPDAEVWQANYDFNPANSGTLKLQRVSISGNPCGMVNWGPVSVPSGVITPVTPDDCVIVWTGAPGPQIFRADNFGAGWTSTQLTFDTDDKSTPFIAWNGGKIVYRGDWSAGEGLRMMNHNGTGDTDWEVPGGMYADIRYPSFSRDGQWVLYSKNTGTEWQICGRHITQTSASEVVIVSGLSIFGNPPAPQFNPDRTKVVYAKYDGTQYDLYAKDVVVDDMTRTITVGVERQLTNTPTVNETDPSYSNTGEKIIFVRTDTATLINQLYTISSAGGLLEQVYDNAAHSPLSCPLYGPATSGLPASNTDMVGFVQNGTLWVGYVFRNITDNVLGNPALGYNPMFSLAQMSAVPYGVIAPSDGRFSWGIRRQLGRILATRYLPDMAPGSGGSLTYDIVVDVDEASLPSGYTLNEVMPGTVTVTQVVVDGTTLASGSNGYIWFTDYPEPGFNTLRILFNALPGRPAPVNEVTDHLIRITVNNGGDPGASVSFSGTINFFLGSTPVVTTILGASTFLTANPYLPVDIFDNFGGFMADGFIQDFDLLYAIDAWARNARLSGYGMGWPADLSNWDAILLDIIEIWADGTYKGEYKYDASIPGAAHEMYWTAGPRNF